MKIPVYTSRGDLTTKSGSVFNPGVSVPYSIAAAQAKGAAITARGLGAVAEWAEKKQDLDDKTEATKAAVKYKIQLSEARDSILYPRDETSKFYNLTNRQRETVWEAAKKTLARTVVVQADIAGSPARSGLRLTLDSVTTDQDTKFKAVINKRILTQASAAALVRMDDRIADLGANPYMTIEESLSIRNAQEKDWQNALSIGLFTAQQVHKQREDFRLKVMTRLVDVAASNHKDEDGVIDRKWLNDLEEAPYTALKDFDSAKVAWARSSFDEQKGIIEGLRKTRATNLTAAVRDGKLREKADEDGVSRLMAELYSIRLADNTDENMKERQELFGVISVIHKRDPEATTIALLGAAQQYAFGNDEGINDDEEFLELQANINNIVTFSLGLKAGKEEEIHLASVTRKMILGARLSRRNRSTLLTLLATALNKRVTEGNLMIKRAAGLVADVGGALEIVQNPDLIMFVSEATSRFSYWVSLNKQEGKVAIFNKAREIAEEVRQSVSYLYVSDWESAKAGFQGRSWWPEISQLVGKDVTELFETGKRTEVLDAMMRKGKGPYEVKYNTIWRRAIVLQLKALEMKFRRAYPQ